MMCGTLGIIKVYDLSTGIQVLHVLLCFISVFFQVVKNVKVMILFLFYFRLMSLLNPMDGQ